MVTSLYTSSAADALSNIKKSSDLAGHAMSRLASGSKLNRASDDPAARSIATSLKSNIGSANAVINNMESGSSMVNIVSNSYFKILDQVLRLQELATQASSSTLSPDLLGQVDLEFQKGLEFITNVAQTTTFNNKVLLEGGASTITQHAASAALANGIVDVTGTYANTFVAAPFVVAEARGFITGSATSATVTGVSGNYDVNVTIGNKTFSTKGFVEAADAVLRLSAADGSRISFTLANGVGGLGTATDFQTALRAVLGLQGGDAPASFKSAITANNNGTNGITVTGSPQQGEYAIWSLAGSNEIVLANEKNYWKASITADGAQTVNFSNGISLALDNTYLRNTAITNLAFKANPSATGVSITLQSGISPNDSVSTDIAGATASTLGINTLNVKTQAAAQAAGTKLEQVRNLLTSYVANVGAFQKSLDNIKSNLESMIDTLKGAYSSLNDADIFEELTNQTNAMVGTQIAIAALNNARELTESLLQAVRG